MCYTQEGLRNRTEAAEPNRTEPFNSGTGRNRTRKRTELHQTEPRSVRNTQTEPTKRLCCKSCVHKLILYMVQLEHVIAVMFDIVIVQLRPSHQFMLYIIIS